MTVGCEAPHFLVFRCAHASPIEVDEAQQEALADGVRGGAVVLLLRRIGVLLTLLLRRLHTHGPGETMAMRCVKEAPPQESRLRPCEKVA